MIDFGRFWWSTGFYARASWFSHTLQPGDIFGTVWVRSVVGVGF
jgi:hypothetical protein